MKVWLVLMLNGAVGGVWGPLPYGLEECRARIPTVIAEMNELEPGHTAECRLAESRPFF